MSQLTLTCTIVEAGILVGSIDPTQPTAKRLTDAAVAGWDDGATHVDVAMTPFEAGIVLNGLANSSHPSAIDIAGRVVAGINELLGSETVTPLPPAPGAVTAPAAGMDPAKAPDDNPPTSAPAPDETEGGDGDATEEKDSEKDT